MNLKSLAPSASLEILRIATEMNRKGVKVHSLSVGDTHFDPPLGIGNNLKTLPKKYSHYTVGQGILELREEISVYQREVFSPDQILITPGLKQGLYYVLTCIEAKRLCVLEPAWLGYKALSQIVGMQYLAVDTNSDDWLGQLDRIDFDILMICSPNNPNGKILEEGTIDEIIKIASKKQAWIITDEIYSVFDFRNRSDENPLEKLHHYDNVVVGNGLSKSHAMTGFRLGYVMTTDSNLMQKMTNVHQNLATCAPAVSQYLSLGFSKSRDEVLSFKKYYEINCNRVSELLAKARPFKPDGGFYYFIDLKKYHITNANEFCKKLLETKSVALVPGSAYGTGFDSFIRLSFSVDRVALEQALPLVDDFIDNYDEDR